MLLLRGQSKRRMTRRLGGDGDGVWTAHESATLCAMLLLRARAAGPTSRSSRVGDAKTNRCAFSPPLPPPSPRPAMASATAAPAPVASAFIERRTLGPSALLAIKGGLWGTVVAASQAAGASPRARRPRRAAAAAARQCARDACGCCGACIGLARAERAARAAWLPALPAHSFPTAPFAPPALVRPAGASWLAESRAARASGQAVCGEALKRGFASRATTFFPAIIG